MRDFILLDPKSKKPTMINISAIRSYIPKGSGTLIAFVDGDSKETHISFPDFSAMIDSAQKGEAHTDISNKFTADGEIILHSIGNWDLTPTCMYNRVSKEPINNFGTAASGADIADHIAESRQYSEKEMSDFRDILDYAREIEKL